MKKTFVFFMVVILLFTSFTSVFALQSANEHPETIYLSKNNEGKFVQSKDKSMKTKAILTEDEGVYRTSTGELLRVYPNTFVRVEKAQSKLKDLAKVKSIVAKLDLPKEVAEDILEDSQKAIANNNNESMLSVIAPKKVTSDVSTTELQSSMVITSSTSDTDY